MKKEGRKKGRKQAGKLERLLISYKIKFLD